MNTSTLTAADLLTAALADLERATSDVIAHNSARMQHSFIRRWLTEGGAEPADKIVGIVSTAPAVRIQRALQRQEPVSIADVSNAIATMLSGLARALRRERAAGQVQRRAA